MRHKLYGRLFFMHLGSIFLGSGVGCLLTGMELWGLLCVVVVGVCFWSCGFEWREHP